MCMHEFARGYACVPEYVHACRPSLPWVGIRIIQTYPSREQKSPLVLLHLLGMFEQVDTEQ